MLVECVDLPSELAVLPPEALCYIKRPDISILYHPRTVLYPLPFSFRKGSEAALLGHVTTYLNPTKRLRDLN